MQSEAMKQEEIEALAREMAKGVKTEADLQAVTRTLTKTLIETALKAEMTDHLGYEAHDRSGVEKWTPLVGQCGSDLKVTSSVVIMLPVRAV
ncbi:protein of unknown function [uncultured Woeseiaceae bacterium]|uniref:Transposase n=1 Tax=uncultured Woeseiaceae bacterium TaxID=1983305 RepID=A0A7D9H5C8_9GAMM|nr:protein of unknown function [uncultured Woeseiaceae bacterium]